MTVKSKVKELFKKVVSPYYSFRKFFGSTNTNLLLLIFFLMFLILSVDAPETRLANDEIDFELILKDLTEFQSFNASLPSKKEYDFLIIKKRLDSVKLKSKSGEIVYDTKLEKFVYRNMKLNKEIKERIYFKFDSLKCFDNYCFF